MGAISRSRALEALRATLLQGCRSFAVLPAEWSKLLAGRGQAPPMLICFVGAATQFALPREPVMLSSSSNIIDTSHSTVSLESVLLLVRRIAGTELVDADQPIMEAGIDSLGAVELSSQLQAAAGSGVAG